ncbi:hypothetical protein ACWO0M_004659 [Vibrio parahaemolyticus]|uniref:hypothetical protein n=1 Tax=Vibrio parahaemolyticus TaxID=670 RepID=UPI00186A0178|nr:hypothetical protein [Vibrio parahaemolyticus]EGR1755050.1 hypothetical protein [Vibrio parahaemolyticus]ELB2095406.1 hypothetical protein [Vibrio parahaemolyticus]ELB2127395.1 hypothetical protein [Vibrio parahaemolyticus]MBE4309468.1 hypothetical protein [Vibrio parahaemolyticus]MDF5667991.1 hypothetical protein [Vibrio parahaemolyticus]
MDKKEFLALSEELAKPINFEELVASGALIQKGKSYYLGNKDLLPKNVSRKIKSMEQNRNGIKVTFRK